MGRKPVKRTPAGVAARQLREERGWCQEDVALMSAQFARRVSLKAVAGFEQRPEGSRKHTIETLAKVYGFSTAQELRRAVGLDAPPVSDEIHKSAQNGTSRAGVPSVPREIPRPLSHQDAPSGADVSEVDMLRALAHIVREYNLTSAQSLEFIIKAGVLAASIASAKEGLLTPQLHSHGP